MASTLCSSSMALSESKTYILTTSLSLESSRTSSDPSSKDKSTSCPQVATLGIENGLMTSEDLFFIAYEWVAKELLAEITGGGVTGEVLSV